MRKKITLIIIILEPSTFFCMICGCVTVTMTYNRMCDKILYYITVLW